MSQESGTDNRAFVWKIAVFVAGLALAASQPVICFICLVCFII
jgi:hypothetical protein